jgi:hypothetical protein
MIFFYFLILAYASGNAYGQICANYIVKSGDTFWSLAGQYRTTVQSIAASNPTVNQNALRIGKLNIF